MPATNQSKSPVKTEERYIGEVPGCLVLLDRAGRHPASPVSPFVARSISMSRAVISVGIELHRGQPMALRFDTVGVRHGVVDRVLPKGCIVSFSGDHAAEADLEARIDWLKRKSRGQVEDHRVAKRVLPRSPSVTVVLGAERIVEAKIKDMSETGVALFAPLQPQLGHLLSVGSVAGHVARHFRGGFAVRFLERQQLGQLEDLMTRSGRPDKARAVARQGSAA